MRRVIVLALTFITIAAVAPTLCAAWDPLSDRAPERLSELFPHLGGAGVRTGIPFNAHANAVILDTGDRIVRLNKSFIDYDFTSPSFVQFAEGTAEIVTGAAYRADGDDALILSTIQWGRLNGIEYTRWSRRDLSFEPWCQTWFGFRRCPSAE